MFICKVGSAFQTPSFFSIWLDQLFRSQLWGAASFIVEHVMTLGSIFDHFSFYKWLHLAMTNILEVWV